MKPLFLVFVTFGLTLATATANAVTTPEPHHLQPNAPRSVTVTEAGTPPVIRAGLLQSTLILLPAEEKIATVFGGDTVDWVFDGGHVASRFISIKPKLANTSTNIHIVSDHGNEYTLQLQEISNDADTHFDSKVFIVPGDKVAKDSLVMHGTFAVSGVDTKVFFGGNVHHGELEEIVRITRYHNREERIESDIVKLPHHCSYLSLGPDKGTDCTTPTPNIAYMYDKKLSANAILISSSRSVPASDEDNQPPHRQAKRYYTGCLSVGGNLGITMEHPTASKPEPLVIEITASRGRINRPFVSGASAAVASVPPRAGA